MLGAVGNAGHEVYPGYSGLVVVKGQAGGGKPTELRSMTWGFPLVLVAKQNRRSRDNGKNGQPLKPKPVNNARAGSGCEAGQRPT